MNNFFKLGSLVHRTLPIVHRSTKYDRRWTFILIIMFFAAGCAKLQHLDQLLTLKGLSDEQTQMGQEIERQDAKFERLVAAVEEGSIAKYKSQKSVLGQFGSPIFTEKVEEDGRPLEVWVYRYAARFFDSPKVYLYWDQAGNLIRWDYQGGQDGKIEPETPQEI